MVRVIISEGDALIVFSFLLRLRPWDVPRGSCWRRFLLLLADALAVADVWHFDAVIAILFRAVLLHGKVVAVFVGRVVLVNYQVGIGSFCAFEEAGFVQFGNVDFEFDHSFMVQGK